MCCFGLSTYTFGGAERSGFLLRNLGENHRLGTMTSVKRSRAAAFGLGHVSGPGDETIAALVRALDDADIFVKQAAAKALMQLGRATEPVVEALRRAMDHCHYEVWRTATVSLIRLGAFSEDLIAKLLSKTHSRWGIDHFAATSCLGELRLARSDIVAALFRGVREGHPATWSGLGMLDWKNSSEAFARH